MMIGYDDVESVEAKVDFIFLKIIADYLNIVVFFCNKA
jgi:hypothetical protein